MKYITKICFVLLLLFYLAIHLYSFESISISSHFTIPHVVSDNTELNKDIKIFYEYIDAFYTLPDKQQPTNIFHDPEIWDPIECYNRVMFSFNIYTAKWIIQPLAMVYSFVIPNYVRRGIRRMDGNIQMPGRLVNSLLQAKFKRAGIEVTRFGINTTIGILGFYDSADIWFGMEPRINNFGQTFAYWGIGKGFYLVLPIQGNTCLRNGIGLVGDYFTNPITYIPPFIFWNWISWGIKLGLAFNNMTLDLEDFLRVCQSSLDPYETMKTVWAILENIKEARDAME